MWDVVEHAPEYHGGSRISTPWSSSCDFILRLAKIGVKLIKLRADQADYIVVKPEGPFKSGNYRYWDSSAVIAGA
ncbi:MAG: adenosylhomocysteinase [Rhodopseudomonas sp.]|nr:adenosylhomocysteinase [Rhodopseudomonas sp.]